MSKMSSEEANGHGDDEVRVRTRVSRACTRCRSRKDRCDGQRPSCTTCLNANTLTQCVYEPSTKTRGLPQGYVRGLEKLLSILISRFDGFEEAAVQFLETERDDLIKVWKQRSTGEELHNSWKESRLLQSLEGLLAALDTGGLTGTKRTRELKDDEDIPNASLIEELRPCLDHILRPTHSVTPSSPNGSSLQTHRAPMPIDQALVLPPDSLDSINSYFQLVHCWLPMLDRGEMRKRCYELARQQILPHAPDSTLAVLTAALALGSLQSALIPQAKNALDATHLYQTSKRCIPFTDGTYVLGHVQALVLLALADISGARWSHAWITIGLAGRAILDIRKTNPLATVPQHVRATLQACFMVETLVALRLQQMPQLKSEQLLDRMIEDGHDEWEPLPNSSEPGFLISTFNKLTDAFRVLNDSLHLYNGQVDIDRLHQVARSFPSILDGTTPSTIHRAALSAVCHCILVYVQQKAGVPYHTLSTNLTKASTLLSSVDPSKSTIIAHALLETVQQSLARQQTGAPNKRQRLDTTHNELQLWPADPFSGTYLDQANTTTPEGLMQFQGQDRGTAAPLDHLPDSMYWKATGQAHSDRLRQAPILPYNSSIATSPSFHGDEIDALFREMAQLDTAELTNGRAQGLGFSDESAFEAFCNDPDRVFPEVQLPSTLQFPADSMLFSGLDQRPHPVQVESNIDPVDLTRRAWN